MAPIGRHVSQAQRLEEGFGSMSEMGSIVVTDVIAVMSSTVEAFLFVACRQRRSLDKLEMTEAVPGMTVKRMHERWDIALRAIGTTQGRTLRMQYATCCIGSGPSRWAGGREEEAVASMGRQEEKVAGRAGRNWFMRWPPAANTRRARGAQSRKIGDDHRMHKACKNTAIPLELGTSGVGPWYHPCLPRVHTLRPCLHNTRVNSAFMVGRPHGRDAVAL
jgi:hypothetical protein